MTYRDTPADIPPCPVCERTDEVRAHDKPQQGRWLCLREMLLFDGTSAEYLPPPARAAITDEIEHARAALEEAADQ